MSSPSFGVRHAPAHAKLLHFNPVRILDAEASQSLEALKTLMEERDYFAHFDTLKENCWSCAPPDQKEELYKSISYLEEVACMAQELINHLRDVSIKPAANKREDHPNKN
jgi:hypothetical protein